MEQQAQAQQQQTAPKKFNLEEHLAKLLTLKFYAICPNGQYIPVEQLCEKARKSTKDYVYRTFDDRLVIVLEAVFPGEGIYNGSMSVLIDKLTDEVYWRQAFYLSTGESSNMRYTWLPFSGIFFNLHSNLHVDRNLGYKYGEKYDILGETWFAKHEYTAPEYGIQLSHRYEFPNTQYFSGQNQRMTEFLSNLYGRLYLPEGNFIKSSSSGRSFDRFGCPSYALASHAIGGEFFRPMETFPGHFVHAGDSLFSSFKMQVANSAGYKSIKDKLNETSRVQACFPKFATSYPIVKPNVVNKYIDDNKAIPIMNAFRELGVFPPGFTLIQYPIQEMGYALPIVEYYNMLIETVYFLWKSFMVGKYSKEKLIEKLKDPRVYIRHFRKKHILTNNNLFDFNFSGISNRQRKYYGGTRRRRTNLSRKQTRRH